MKFLFLIFGLVLGVGFTGIYYENQYKEPHICKPLAHFNKPIDSIVDGTLWLKDSTSKDTLFFTRYQWYEVITTDSDVIHYLFKPNVTIE